jgi:hypothetical protein
MLRSSLQIHPSWCLRLSCRPSVVLMANRGKSCFFGNFLFCLVLMILDSTSGGMSAPNNSSGVRPLHVVRMIPTRVTVEVPSVVCNPSQSVRSAVPAASRPVGSSQRVVPRAESTVVVQQISPTPTSPKKKVVKKSKKWACEEEEETSANKKHRSNCEFFIFLPPFKALFNVLDVFPRFFYFILARLILFLCSSLCCCRRSPIRQGQQIHCWSVPLVELC